MTTYICGISDGMNWNAGGQTTITADSLEHAKVEAQDWADEGDYPCLPPVTVTLVLRTELAEVARWQHRVPDTACSGTAD